MNKKKTIMLGIIILTVVMISGISFALWQITLKQESTNVITTGCFKIEFQDENPISLSNAFPITDEEGRVLIPYTFTITNTCDSYASYQINLEILKDTTLENLDYLKIMFDDNIDFLNKKETVSKTLENATTAKKLETGYLDIDESKTYHLRLWMSENTPNDESFMNKIFNSKVTIIATYQTEFDKESPISTIEVTNLSNQIKVDASSSSDNTNIKYYYYSLDGESFVKTSKPEYTFEVGDLEYGVATETIKTLADSLEDEYTVYVKTEDEYGNVSEVVSKKVYKDFAYDETIDNNLRYIGANPNNYVSFNNELWRVIGVMENIDDGTGLKGTRIKLIRNASIGTYSWDTSIEEINAGYGVNEWKQAKLNILLNDFYYNSKSNQECYYGRYNGTIPCSFDESGLQEMARLYMDDVLWHTGTYEKGKSVNELLSEEFYEAERSDNTGRVCVADESTCSDTVVRSSTWKGKIGLLYPSDYGYAVSNNNEARNFCLSIPLKKWDEHTNCYTNNWMFISENKWTMMPLPSEKHSTKVAYISHHLRDSYDAYGTLPVYPVIFLKSTVKIISGNGSEQTPYELSGIPDNSF